MALALLAAACSGGDGEAEGSTAPAVTRSEQPLDGGTASAEPGTVLLAFVRAAGRGDPDAMWRLLSEPTRASIGPTLEDFRGAAAQDLASGIGPLAPTAKVILSRALGDGWAVAAVAGDVLEEGESEPEYNAYAAALVAAKDGLRLELGGVVISGYKPGHLDKLDDAQPKLAASAGAGRDLTTVRMWLDGKPFPAERGANDTPFTATLHGRPAQPLRPGLHQVVVFAATNETATAAAWAFTVEEP